MATFSTTTKANPGETQRMIRLRSMVDDNGSSGVFELPIEAAQLSIFLRDATEDWQDNDMEDDDDKDNDDAGGSKEDPRVLEIDIPRVGSECLGKIVEFLKHYNEERMNDVPEFLVGTTFNEIMTQEWYQTFLSDETLGIKPGKGGDENDRGTKMLFEMVQAGNFLGIEKIIDIVILRLTFMMVGKDQEEIRTFLEIPRMTLEERAQVERDYPWIFEQSS